MALKAIESDPVHNQVYRSLDSIDNFFVRVTIKRVTGGSAPDVVQQGDVEDGPEPKEKPNKVRNGMGIEVRWQEKVFGLREVWRYNTDQTIHGPLELGYKREIQKMYGANWEGQGSVLFTYVDQDHHLDEIDWAGGATYCMDGTTAPQSSLAKAYFQFQSEGRQRKSRRAKLVQWLLADRKGEEDGKATMFRQSFEHFDASLESSKNMSVMLGVDEIATTKKKSRFHKSTPVWPGSEITLVSVKQFADGSIIMKPPYSPRNEDGVLVPFKVETDSGLLVEFTVENAAPEASDDFNRQEKKIRQDLKIRELDLRQNLVGQEFEKQPSENSMRVVVMGEVVSARNFDKDDIFVTFETTFPQNWEVKNGRMKASTQIGRAKSDWDDSSVCYFAMPFEYSAIRVDEEDKPKVPPKMFFQVSAYDNLDRYSAEGYGYVDIPSEPGFYKMYVKTWKPRGTIRQQRSSFFIAGSAELTSLQQTHSLNPCDNMQILNKYGFGVDSSGVVHVNMHVIVQHGASPDEGMTTGPFGTLLGRSLGPFSRVRDVGAVGAASPRHINNLPQTQRTILASSAVLERAKQRLLERVKGHQ